MMLLRFILLLMVGTSASAAEDFCRELKERYKLPQKLVHLDPRDREDYYRELETLFSRIPSFKIDWVDTRQYLPC